MDDQGKVSLFQSVKIKLCPDGLKPDGLRRLAELEQVAPGPGGFRKFPNFLQGDQFTVILGYDAQAGGATVFGVGLFIERESFIQETKDLKMKILF